MWMRVSEARAAEQREGEGKLGEVRTPGGIQVTWSLADPSTRPPLREIETHHKVLGQRVNDLSHVLNGSPRSSSGGQTAEDQHGGREASRAPSALTQGSRWGCIRRNQEGQKGSGSG